MAEKSYGPKGWSAGVLARVPGTPVDIALVDDYRYVWAVCCTRCEKRLFDFALGFDRESDRKWIELTRRCPKCKQDNQTTVRHWADKVEPENADREWFCSCGYFLAHINDYKGIISRLPCRCRGRAVKPYVRIDEAFAVSLYPCRPKQTDAERQQAADQLGQQRRKLGMLGGRSIRAYSLFNSERR